MLPEIKCCSPLELGVRSVKLPVCKSQNVRTNKTFVFGETTCKKDGLQQKTNFVEIKCTRNSNRNVPLFVAD